MDVATLGIKVDANGAITVLDKFGQKVDSVEAKTSKFESTIKRLGAYLTAGLVANKFVQETIAQEHAIAQLDAAVRATGGSAGYTTRQLLEMSYQIQATTVFADEVAASAMSVMLAFRQIKGDTFKQAMDAAANLATRMKTDLTSAALQVGKALADPESGLTLLRRSGILFSESQQIVIKRLVDTGNLAQAQVLILAELEKQFGGAAAAARNTFGGALAGLKNDFGDWFELSDGGAAAATKAINAVSAAVRAVLPYMNQLLSLAIAAVTVWGAYKAALMSVAVYHAVVAGAQTIQAFISLALTIRKAADAAALFSLVGGSMVKIAAAIVALTIGWIAYKKMMEQVNAENQKFADSMPTATELPGLTKFQTDMVYANEERVRLAQQEYDLVGKTGVALAKLQNQQEALNEAKRIAHERGIQNIEDLDRETKYSIGAAMMLKNRAAEARFQFERIEETWKNMVSSIQSTMSDFFGGLFTEGVTSFQSLIDNVKRMFFKMVGDVLAAKAMQKLISLFAGDSKPVGVQQMAAATTMLSAAQIQQQAAATMAAAAGVQVSAPGTGAASVITKLQKWGGLGGIGLAGLGVGYGLGKSIGGAGGVVAGAGVGAAQGAALGSILPGVGTAVGAVVGGLAGLVGGLFGASKAAKESREELERLKTSYQDNITVVRAQLGITDSLTAEISRIGIQFDELRKQAEAAYPVQEGYWAQARRSLGIVTAAEAERARQLDEINRLEALAIAQAVQRQQELRREMDQDIEIRRLRALGMNEAADLMAEQAQRERELAEWRRRGATEAQLLELAEVQRMESVARAMEKTKAKIQELENTVSGLKDFRNSLLLSPDAGLSDTARLAEARRQYEETLAAALAGDQAAAGRLPAGAQALLQASRAVNASGTGFQNDLQKVLADTQSVIDKFQDLKSIEEKMLEELIKIRETGEIQLRERQMPPPGTIPTVPTGGETDTDVPEAIDRGTEITRTGLLELAARMEQLIEEVRNVGGDIRNSFDGIRATVT